MYINNLLIFSIRYDYKLISNKGKELNFDLKKINNILVWSSVTKFLCILVLAFDFYIYRVYRGI